MAFVYVSYVVAIFGLPLACLLVLLRESFMEHFLLPTPMRDSTGRV